jgi:hypothetical protein
VQKRQNIFALLGSLTVSQIISGASVEKVTRLFCKKLKVTFSASAPEMIWKSTIWDLKKPSWFGQ